MRSAIDLAITGTPADPSDVQAHCDKGNCTFEAYSTLGVCSRVDVVPHDSIVQTCPRDKYGEPMGCNYIVQELQTHPPWRIGNLTTGSNGPSSAASPSYTLWMGSSDIVPMPLTPEDPYNYMFPSPETLTEFYTVYVADTRGYMQGDSTPEFFSSIAALKVGLDLCVYQYNTSVINGETKTVQMSRTTDLKWAKDSVNASSATMDGKDYTMGEDTIRQFSNYLGLEVFYGSSWIGINVVTSDGSGAPATDTPNVFAGLIVNRSVSEGQDGVRKKMDNLAVGMTNALVFSSPAPRFFPPRYTTLLLSYARPPPLRPLSPPSLSNMDLPLALDSACLAMKSTKSPAPPQNPSSTFPSISAGSSYPS